MDSAQGAYKELQKAIKENYPPKTDTTMVELAFEFANAAHKGQVRITGEPYVVHPLITATRLAQMKLELPVIVAAILHDVPEDTDRTLEEIRKEFGDDVASMVAGVTKLGKVQYRGLDRYVENLRKMFYAMAADIRTIFIKFADRLHNMETLHVVPEPKRTRIAREVLEIYAPIANRLGMGEFKGKFEDLAFRYVDPPEYARVKELREKNIKVREQGLDQTIALLKDLLKQAGVHTISIHGRVKNIYSLHKKLERYENDISQIYDLVAVRVLVERVADCYAALGVLHSRWKPLKGRIKDYIAQPKPNGYQSLHTTIFAEKGIIIEVQIRTPEMHENAEFGTATHWQYKESDFGKKKRDLEWVEELVKVQQELHSRQEFLEHLEDLKFDAFRDRIFVFTPKGDVIDLAEGSTPIDFAYRVHSEIGNRCVSCRVNGEMSNLDTELKSGDVCEITIDKNRKTPNPDWLRFVKTRHARNKIKDATRHTMKGWILTQMEKHEKKKTVKKKSEGKG